MTDFKTSFIVDKQVPQFIREDHPKFISFLEAYYEFLENEQFTDGDSQLNDVTTQLKKFKYISDIDRSLDDFEDRFMAMFAPLIPADTVLTKDFLLKHLFPLYNSKGSEKSFRLLFRMLFGEEIAIKTPKDSILKCSDGKWKVEKILRIDPTIQSYYTGDGTTTEFLLPQEISANEYTVYIDGILQVTGYFVKKELKKIIFDSAPTNNAIIKILYTNFDVSLLANRKIIGESSNASAVIEKINIRNISGEYYYQIYIDNKTIVGSFLNGETLTCDIISNDVLINIRLSTLSQLDRIDIVNPGASYNVGDYVTFLDSAPTPAVAIINDVESGTIEDVIVLNGGAGFKVGDNVKAVGISNTAFEGDVISVDSTGRNTLNTVTIYTDIISDYQNIVLSNTNYGFPVVGTENTNTSIINALSSVVITDLGPITAANVMISTISSDEVIYVEPTHIAGNIRLNDIGILGKINIANAGINYTIGEYLQFNNLSGDYSGRNANAHISNVAANGAITAVTINNGGQGYQNELLPIITISTANGTGANLVVTTIMGEGESIQGVLPRDADGNIVYAGQIKSIRILESGAGYVASPRIDLSGKGNGLATANAIIQDSIQILPGRWTSADGILSSDEARIQGRDYYINYSYLISSQVEFKKYKKLLHDIMHPVGMIDYCEYNIKDTINSETGSITNILNTRDISGTVNTNSSIYVIGTNTKFVLSNTNGILVPGANISINNSIKTVNTILSNTMLTVTSAYSFTANAQTLTIIS